MPRYAIHIRVTEDLWETCDPAITVLVDAHDDQMAQLNAVALMRGDLEFEIEEVEIIEGECAHIASVAREMRTDA